MPKELAYKSSTNLYVSSLTICLKYFDYLEFQEFLFYIFVLGANVTPVKSTKKKDSRKHIHRSYMWSIPHLGKQLKYSSLLKRNPAWLWSPLSFILSKKWFFIVYFYKYSSLNYSPKWNPRIQNTRLRLVSGKFEGKCKRKIERKSKRKQKMKKNKNKAKSNILCFFAT